MPSASWRGCAGGPLRALPECPAKNRQGSGPHGAWGLCSFGQTRSMWEDRCRARRPEIEPPYPTEGVAMEAHSKMKLVDADTPGSAERGITASVSRSEIEETLRSADGPAVLVLDIARVQNGASNQGDVEAHTLALELERPELEQLLESTKDDAIALRFDQAELEQALAEADVEAHGLREKALVLTAVAATAAGVSGQAAAMTMGGDGATAATATASAPISDVVSGGPAPIQAAEQSPLTSDVVSGGPASAQPAAEAAAISDVLSGGPAPIQAAEQSPLVSDVVSGGPASTQPAAEAAAISDVLSGGPAPTQAAEQSPSVSDVVSGGPAPTQAVEASGGGGGISISAPQAWETGLAGGLTLLVITGAGFAAARHRHQR